MLYLLQNDPMPKADIITMLLTVIIVALLFALFFFLKWWGSWNKKPVEKYPQAFKTPKEVDEFFKCELDEFELESYHKN